MTSRIAAINVESPMRAFLGALLNQSVLKVCAKGFFSTAEHQAPLMARPGVTSSTPLTPNQRPSNSMVKKRPQIGPPLTTHQDEPAALAWTNSISMPRPRPRGLGALYRTPMIRKSSQLGKLDVTTLGFEIGKERLCDDRNPLARRMNDVPMATYGQPFDI